jgi:hypothetical protein
MPTENNSQPDIKEIITDTISFDLESCIYAYLKDTLIFNEEDFIDRNYDCKDGISNSILYLFENGNIQNVKLNNDFTKNQIKLFTKILDAAIIAQPENRYFKALREYY